MELVGYRRSAFTAQDTGERISGYNLYLEEQDENVEGVRTDRVFLSDKKMNGYIPRVGDQLEVVYNRYGKVSELRLLRDMV